MNVVDSLESKDINQFFKKVNKVHKYVLKEERPLTERKIRLAMKLINENVTKE